VFKIEGLGKTWKRADGGEKTVFSGVSGMIRRLDKIAVVG
jgi:ATP-binding cassette subfamily F protein 3